MASGEHLASGLFQELRKANNEVSNVGTKLAEEILNGERTGEVTDQPEYIAATMARIEAEERLRLALNPSYIFET